ncbi:hypothetical protein NPIL_23111 [Nephila pilipes]|uniref:Uncharacterized protein n=1 Tax=Nephila pilipes TaxID=299642 RepID=A0A8X6Q3Y5_NEPPI|nr:hypothetical protein NPIL_167181 [Nephila pilipes]GFT98687.1 hypothetical protein NPIL_23111 [Nephila pilipes]
MATNHSFSSSLFEKLFKHNLVSAKGYVKGTREELIEFRNLLLLEARDRTTVLYKQRVLRRDLKELDEWLEKISKPDTEVHYFTSKPPEESKMDEYRFRKRTASK